MLVAVAYRQEKRVKKRKKVVKSKLSFAVDEEEYKEEDGADPMNSEEEDEGEEHKRAFASFTQVLTSRFDPNPKTTIIGANHVKNVGSDAVVLTDHSRSTRRETWKRPPF